LKKKLPKGPNGPIHGNYLNLVPPTYTPSSHEPLELAKVRHFDSYD